MPTPEEVEKQIKRKRKLLDIDLKNNRPNERQSAYAKFYFDNTGYDWINNSSGKVFTKNMLFDRFYDFTPYDLTQLTTNTHAHFQKKLRSGFKEVYEHGIKIAKLIIVENE